MSNPFPSAAPSCCTPRLREQAPPTATALRLGALLTLVLAAALTHAESPFEKRYQGRGDGRLDFQLFELGDGSGAHFVVADTAIPNECTGEPRGLATPGGPRALVLTRKPSGSEEACTLRLRFGPNAERVRAEEQGCGDFHGASCAFGGALTRR
ncbi:hypothetical protein [Methylobacterium sp. NEAU K]|uniref:hypothetical protein n=1 Tax=Methylobacterium sp. NEAU K TaxID=3064946 RepID=UPI00273576C7|nr:hypothetical protein [Methylobacterium sp. NEAU K]MDP4006320.1 hypothetical protein [Methylobacterium sp. NEAU K]